MLSREQCEAKRTKSGNAWRRWHGGTLSGPGLLEWYEQDIADLLDTVEELRGQLRNAQCFVKSMMRLAKKHGPTTPEYRRAIRAAEQGSSDIDKALE